MKNKVRIDFSKGIDRFHFSNQLIKTMTKLHMFPHQYHVLFFILTLPKTMSKKYVCQESDQCYEHEGCPCLQFCQMPTGAYIQFMRCRKGIPIKHQVNACLCYPLRIPLIQMLLIWVDENAILISKHHSNANFANSLTLEIKFYINLSLFSKWISNFEDQSLVFENT